MSEERVHATLGASSAHRWWPCPGSVALSEGQPSITSVHAEEGTRAHEFAAAWLASWSPPLDDTVPDEMVEAVAVFVDYCRSVTPEGGFRWIEHRFDLAALNPPAPMYGTADYVTFDPNTGTLHVIDLKYGKGVVVEVKGNKQLRYYGLGALLTLADGRNIRRVRITIVQPRVSHQDGTIRYEEISVSDLLDFSADLLEAAAATQQPNAPLVVGSHCRFCPALAICPAQAANAQALAQVEFADMPIDKPPRPELLPVAVLADMLQKAPILEGWLDALRAHAQRLLEAGEEVPGFKLVPRRATRKWVDEVEVYNWLEGRGYKNEDIEESKLKSPAQIEKVLGKAKKDLPKDLYESKSSGNTIAPLHDARPEVTLTTGDEFLALPSGEPNGLDTWDAT